MRSLPDFCKPAPQTIPGQIKRPIFMENICDLFRHIYEPENDIKLTGFGQLQTA